MTRPSPRVGLNFLPEDDFRVAAMPLFEAGLVDALERDIDFAWGFHPDGERRDEPAWTLDVLDAYAADDALYGHGVWLSVMSGRWTPRQETWMRELAAECARRSYQHVSEHFGWMSAGPYWRNTMLPAPRTPATVALGIDRMRRLADAAGVPVGLENLGMGLGPVDALEQGAFMAEVLDAVDGFVLLDVHNIWTQAYNFRLDPVALLRSYPLARVRELHVSGGDWYEPKHASRPIRLDSHDAAMPGEIWPLVAEAVRACPAAEVVIMERRGGTLGAEAERAAFRDDFLRLRALVEQVCEEAEDTLDSYLPAISGELTT